MMYNLLVIFVCLGVLSGFLVMILDINGMFEKLKKYGWISFYIFSILSLLILYIGI